VNSDVEAIEKPVSSGSPTIKWRINGLRHFSFLCHFYGRPGKGATFPGRAQVGLTHFELFPFSPTAHIEDGQIEFALKQVMDRVFETTRSRCFSRSTARNLGLVSISLQRAVALSCFRLQVCALLFQMVHGTMRP
jgi:hypothetical protein